MTTATRKKGGVQDVTEGNQELTEPTLGNAPSAGSTTLLVLGTGIR